MFARYPPDALSHALPLQGVPPPGEAVQKLAASWCVRRLHLRPPVFPYYTCQDGHGCSAQAAFVVLCAPVLIPEQKGICGQSSSVTDNDVRLEPSRCRAHARRPLGSRVPWGCQTQEHPTQGASGGPGLTLVCRVACESPAEGCPAPPLQGSAATSSSIEVDGSGLVTTLNVPQLPL